MPKVLIRNNNSSTFSNVAIADSPIISGVRSMEFIQTHFIIWFLSLRKQACIETAKVRCRGTISGDIADQV